MRWSSQQWLSGASIALPLTLSTSLTAAPPVLTAMFPAGGTAGTEVSVKLQGTLNAETSQLWMARPGVEFLKAESKDTVRLKIAADAQPGPVWLAVHDAEGISAQRPFVIGTFPEINEAEPNDDITPGATPLALPQVINGVLQKGDDVDSYPVALKVGESLFASMDALKVLGSPMDGLLQVADERGFVLQQTDDAAGFDPQLFFTARREGIYSVRAFAFPSDPNSTIKFSGGPTHIYRLTLSAGPVITQWNPAAVTPGAAVKAIGFGPGIAAEGLTLEFSELSPGLAVPARSEALVSAPLLVSEYPVVAASGTNTRETPDAVTLPITVTGILARRKAEQGWKFTATKGQKFNMRVTTLGLRSPVDAVLVLWDTAGKKYQEFDDAIHGDDEINVEFTAPADGEFVAAVADRFWHFGPQYSYALTMTTSKPYFELAVSQNSYQVKPGDKVEVTVSVARRLGFSDPITVTAENLPEGLTAATVVSEPKGDSSKEVKLVLQSGRETEWVGVVPIVGRSGEGDAQQQRAAVVNPPARQTAPGQIVLKVIGKPAEPAATEPKPAS